MTNSTPNQLQERFEFALESGRMGTWEIDLSNNKVICSKAMLKLWNVLETEVQGNREILQAKVHPDDREKMKARIQHAIDTDTIYELEYRILPDPLTTRWVFSRGRCMYETGSKRPERFSGIVYDITEQKLKEEQVSNLIKARDQFFMIASHELKTPLTLLQLQHHVLESELKDAFPDAFESQKVQEILLKQNENLRRINRIADNILDESQINEGRLRFHFEEVDLSEVVSEILDRFKVSPNAQGVELSANIENKIIGFWDKFRIEQVILNLLSNAVRYGAGSPISVSLQKSQGEAKLSVSDKGPGIKTEDLQRIFSRYERATDDQSIRGIGLGLFICDHIVRAHRGNIYVQNNSDQGAEFTISLPFQG